MPITREANINWDDTVPYEIQEKFCIKVLKHNIIALGQQIVQRRQQVEYLKACLEVGQDLAKHDGRQHFGLIR